MERDLPISSEQDSLARKIRSYVANGNMLVVTGGAWKNNIKKSTNPVNAQKLLVPEKIRLEIKKKSK